MMMMNETLGGQGPKQSVNNKYYPLKNNIIVIGCVLPKTTMVVTLVI
jgi:hypothetical protein